MPDIISLAGRHWKLIFLLTLLATTVAFAATLLSPKLYLSTATALPANSALNDKARIFNTNIEGLYPSIGQPDELDKLEGTTKLDTLFIAIATDFKLAAHYGTEDLYKAALKLKKSSDISRSAYGELKIKVWDKDKGMAAELANSILQKLNEFHKHLQSINDAMVLQKIKHDIAEKEKEVTSLEESRESVVSNTGVYQNARSIDSSKKNSLRPERRFDNMKSAALLDEIKEYQKLINQYELSLKTSPDVLIVVESARPALKWDKPDMLRNSAFAFFASLLFSFLLALFIDSRNKVA
jgi:uncharacterized protein involved in exopolysaccharide biosynthesis